MRIAVIGAGVLASLVFVSLLATLAPSVGFAQRSAAFPTTGETGLLAVTTTVDAQHQQITVIDPGTRVLGVYHVDLSTGEVALKSVRNMHWDLQMMEFNGTSPMPDEVRSILERQ